MPVEEGKTINANQTTPTIAKIADLNKMEIKMEIAEGDISKVKVGQEVDYTILSALDEIKKSKISSIDPALKSLSDGSYDKTSSGGSSGSSEAVYFYAKVLVDNSDNFLKIGMTTENSIIINSAKNVKFITSSAVKKGRNGENFVFVLKNNKPERKLVKIGISDSLNTEILEGIDENDEVIVSNFGTSQNGAKSGVRAPMMRM